MATRSGSAASRTSRPAAVRRRSTARRTGPRDRAGRRPIADRADSACSLGVATLIALLLPGEGKLTDMWRNSIAPWFGSGRWVLPFLMLAVGWWMVERAKGVRGDWELTPSGPPSASARAWG